MRAGEREGAAVAGAAGRRRVPGGAEASPAGAPTLCPLLYRAKPGSPPSWGAEWGRRRESRAARPAGGALGLGAPFGPGLGLGAPGRAGCSGRRARLIVRRVRGRPAAGRASKSGRRPSRGRRAPGESETSCRCCCFLFTNAPWTLAGCLATPGARRGGPGGGGRGRGPASGALPATCQVYCCRARESLRISPAAARPPGARAPLTRPWGPPPGPAPCAQLPAAARGGGRRGGEKRDRPGNLRERR